MKTKGELLQMLFSKLAELQNLNKNEETNWKEEILIPRLRAEVALLYDILGEDVPEEYWEQIEEVI